MGQFTNLATQIRILKKRGNYTRTPLHRELRLELGNGITLSEKAHKEFHSKYGVKRNSVEQISEFLFNIK